MVGKGQSFLQKSSIRALSLYKYAAGIRTTAFVRIVVCSVECSFDLSRMVSIVIDNRYAADLAFFLETTFGAAEFLKTDTGMFHGNAHLDRPGRWKPEHC